MPLLIRWPGAPSGETHELTTSQDLFNTFTEMLGAPVPKDDSENEGTSLTPLLRDANGQLPKRSLYWHFPHYYPRMTPASAIRAGDWKLIHYYEDDR